MSNISSKLYFSNTSERSHAIPHVTDARNTSTRTSLARVAGDYEFRKSSLLDIPFIFELLQDGSQNGSFTSSFCTPRGAMALLIMLLRNLLLPYRRERQTFSKIQTYIFSHISQAELGFLQVSSSRGKHVIELCAIAPQHRNRKHGTRMIQIYLDALPLGTEVFASCTKHSKAMQHILKRLKFKRSKNSYPLERFSFIVEK